jgi:hypothetical protein
MRFYSAKVLKISGIGVFNAMDIIGKDRLFPLEFLKA